MPPVYLNPEMGGIMRIGVVGAGYVGLVAGTCLAEMGNHVHIVDLKEKVVRTLQSGKVHYYEPGLEELLRRNMDDGRLRFSMDIAAMVRDSEVIFLAVGTPQAEDGSADLSAIEAAAVSVAQAMDSYRLIIIKSTVPVGSNARITELIASHTKVPFDVVSNPEFLKEGAAIKDFMYPDRVVVGVRNEKAEKGIRAVYDPFMRTRHLLMVMDPESAEMSKYVSNALLASRISFMNEMANICRGVGADVEWVRQAVGADRRIGASFLFPGLGYGGSCFPKDVRALSRIAEAVGLPADMCASIDRVNVAQRLILLPDIEAEFGASLEGVTFALWGLAFKPRTDDVREAPAIYLANALMDRGASIRAYDPEASETAKCEPGMERATIVDNAYEALDGADALIVATEWNEFRSPDFAEITRRLSRPLIFDGRNVFDPAPAVARGLTIYGVGRALKSTGEAQS